MYQVTTPSLMFPRSLGNYLVFTSWMLYQFGQTSTFGTICALQQNFIQQGLRPPSPTPHSPPPAFPNLAIKLSDSFIVFLWINIDIKVLVVLWPQLKCFSVFPVMCLWLFGLFIALHSSHVTRFSLPFTFPPTDYPTYAYNVDYCLATLNFICFSLLFKT